MGSGEITQSASTTLNSSSTELHQTLGQFCSTATKVMIKLKECQKIVMEIKQKGYFWNLLPSSIQQLLYTLKETM